MDLDSSKGVFFLVGRPLRLPMATGHRGKRGACPWLSKMWYLWVERVIPFALEPGARVVAWDPAPPPYSSKSCKSLRARSSKDEPQGHNKNDKLSEK
jgi:hypothetical protein